MIAHILPLLVAAGIGANARALPVAQGVTGLITPGPAPGQCSLTAPTTFGVSIAPVGGMYPPRDETLFIQGFMAENPWWL